MIRRIDNSTLTRGFYWNIHVFWTQIQFPEYRVQRMFKSTIERISLGGSQFFKIGVNSLSSVRLIAFMGLAQVAYNFVPRKNSLGDFVKYHEGTISWARKHLGARNFLFNFLLPNRQVPILLRRSASSGDSTDHAIARSVVVLGHRLAER